MTHKKCHNLNKGSKPRLRSMPTCEFAARLLVEILSRTN
jgi:hypothetical protein